MAHCMQQCWTFRQKCNIATRLLHAAIQQDVDSYLASSKRPLPWGTYAWAPTSYLTRHWLDVGRGGSVALVGSPGAGHPHCAGNRAPPRAVWPMSG